MATADIATVELLRRGAIAVKGRLPCSTNITLLAEVTLGEASTLAVYKPARGERPLWDFPPGLHRREVAAYLLSEALRWGLVPLTVLREEAPHGPGSLQRFVAADFAQHYFTLLEADAHRDRLRRICAFDLVANNADRKAGHCLLGEDGQVYAIDNGLCFHAEPKLRTVIWEFAGEPVPPAMLDDLSRLVRRRLPSPLAAVLEAEEARALVARARALLGAGRFPTGRGNGRYPWPLL